MSLCCLTVYYGFLLLFHKINFTDNLATNILLFPQNILSAIGLSVIFVGFPILASLILASIMYIGCTFYIDYLTKIETKNLINMKDNENIYDHPNAKTIFINKCSICNNEACHDTWLKQHCGHIIHEVCYNSQEHHTCTICCNSIKKYEHV